MNNGVIINNYFISDWMRIFGINDSSKKTKKTIDRSNGLQFIMYPNEQGHNCGHIHVKYQNDEVVINLLNGETIGTLPPPKMKKAKKWVENNMDYLIEIWNSFTNGVKIPPKEK